MPKQLNEMPKQVIEQIDIRSLISDHLDQYGIKRTWLADRIGMSNTNLHFILKMERELSEEKRILINEALGTTF